MELETSCTLPDNISTIEAICSVVLPNSKVADELSAAEWSNEPVLSAIPEIAPSIP